MASLCEATPSPQGIGEVALLSAGCGVLWKLDKLVSKMAQAWTCPKSKCYAESDRSECSHSISILILMLSILHPLKLYQAFTLMQKVSRNFFNVIHMVRFRTISSNNAQERELAIGSEKSNRQHIVNTNSVQSGTPLYTLLLSYACAPSLNSSKESIWLSLLGADTQLLRALVCVYQAAFPEMPRDDFKRSSLCVHGQMHPIEAIWSH